MSKRKYPYDIDMCPQLKIHINDKQIANGVMKSSKMLEIYEKTKHLLFQGAEASFQAIDQPLIVDNIPCDSKPSKQLQLDLNGKLHKPDLKFKHSTINHFQPKCNFCLKTEKLDYCGKCNDLFCHMCLLSLCNEEVNKICLSCYK